MPGFRDRFSRTDFFNIGYEDSFNPIVGRAARAAMVTGPGAAGDSGLPGNYQPVESAWYIPGPTALIDVYAPTSSTTGTLVVDDPNHVIAACDTPGDNDWFAVTLTAGQTYQFGQYSYAGAGIPGAERNNVPLADAYLEIYDSTGHLLAIADGGGPNTPQGLDALMTFEAPSSGTFYVNATSYDNDGDGVGDFAGDYEIFAQTATGSTVYTTPYDISSPLHSIDWGGVMVNREHVAVHNPDGDDGPRSTGQPAADPADVVGNSLGFPGKNVIYIYFAGEGDLYANADSTIPAQVTAQDPYQYEIQAVLTAAAEFAKVADVVYVSNYTLNPTTHLYERDPTIEYKPGPLGPETGIKYATGVDGDGFDADFFYWSYPGTPGPGVSLLGSMSPPDYGDEGTAQFNSADERWNAQMLQQGGFSFVTLIHELGHGHGLAHPHDTGGGSSIMLDGDTASGHVEETTPFNYTLGDFDLNQGVYTMMSYEDGWQLSPYGQADTVNEGYGWLGSLMALDIAVIQDKYGVNEDWATGNDTYVLKDVNEWAVYIDAATGQPAVHDATNQATTRDGYYVGQGTYYSSIWDAGGVDQIIYNGARDTNIDLRAATLRYEYGGGGWMSYATGIYGGFTIANGVTIENATSGAGNDVLTGNDVPNVLNSGAGNDVLIGGLGADTMSGGLDNDIYFVDNAGDQAVEAAGQGRDIVYATVSYTLGASTEVEVLATQNNTLTNAINFTGNQYAQLVYGNAGANTLNGGGGADYLIGLGGNDTYFIDDANAVVLEAASQGRDIVYSTVSYTLGADAEVEVLAAQNNTLTGVLNFTGNQYAQLIYGNAGANTLNGGGGADYLIGLGGNDTYFVNDASVVVLEGTGQGTDIVYANLSYTLAADSAVEVLATQNNTLTGVLNFTGNNLAQLIYGNAGANTLNGGGGADVLIGLGGNDTYFVNDASATVLEGTGLGTDIVYANVSYTLAADSEVDVLATQNNTLTIAINFTGNNLAQLVFGNAGANVIDGGAGSDGLVGYGGADTFAFTTALGANNVDTIADFAHGTDKIALDNAIFDQLVTGALPSSLFHVGATATDEDQRILYDQATGYLYYDADGLGGTDAVLFAALQGAPIITASDFTVI